MLNEIRKIEVTPTSHPFSTAVGRLQFEEMGYMEEEYFMYGTANVYSEVDDHRAEIVYRDLPYCNRFLMRRPVDMSRFRGNVVVEILNSTAGFDIDRMWIGGAAELMRDGAVYVGITSKPNVIVPMKELDPQRYADLSWKVPYRWEVALDGPAEERHIVPVDDTSETGLFWDMLDDLADLLRDGFGRLNGSNFLYLVGWSQSSIYLRSYIRYFENQRPEGRRFDGYFEAGGIHSMAQPLNQSGYPRAAENVRRTELEYMPVPYIAMQTESENIGFRGAESRKEDGDEPDFLFRRYEAAGATHDTQFSLLDYYRGNEDLKTVGLLPQYMGTDPFPNDYPYQFLFNAVYRKLFRWVREGTAPIPGQVIPLDTDGTVFKDTNGNTVGGLRTPALEYPICTYHEYSHTDTSVAPDGRFILFGHQDPFSAEELAKRYGSLEHYGELIRESAVSCANQGFMAPEDIEDFVALQTAKAAELGLK